MCGIDRRASRVPIVTVVPSGDNGEMMFLREWSFLDRLLDWSEKAFIISPC